MPIGINRKGEIVGPPGYDPYPTPADAEIAAYEEHAAHDAHPSEHPSCVHCNPPPRQIDEQQLEIFRLRGINHELTETLRDVFGYALSRVEDLETITDDLRAQGKLQPADEEALAKGREAVDRARGILERQRLDRMEVRSC